jgi:protein gp37
MTAIEWTQQTWNPIVGCSIVSPGCTNCYAMSMAARLEAMCEKAVSPGPLDHYLGTTRRVNGKPVWTGKLALAGERILTEPLRRRKPTTYFVNSMGDLLHEDCPDEWIDRVFAVMALSPQHTFQVLTKRSARMRAYASEVAATWAKPGHGGSERIRFAMCKLKGVDTDDYNTGLSKWPLDNIWLGVSAERQQEADARIPDLLATPAAVRFVSAEPLLGPIDFNNLPSVSGFGRYLDALSNAGAGDSDLPHCLNWVIVGGESGPHARPMHPDWARSIRDQCAAAGVPFFFKQWGEFANVQQHGPALVSGAVAHPWGADDVFVRKVGKASAGRLLDGVLHDAMPSHRTTTEAA